MILFIDNFPTFPYKCIPNIKIPKAHHKKDTKGTNIELEYFKDSLHKSKIKLYIVQNIAYNGNIYCLLN